MKALQSDLARLKSFLHRGQALKPEVSEKSVLWHIDHSLRVLLVAGQAVLNSKPEDYRWRFNLTRTWILLSGRIPRGKGKAPKAVLPPENIDEAALSQLFSDARVLIGRIQQVNPRAHFPHPFFGHLDREKSLLFFHVHTAHHLRIIEDILA